MEASQQLNKDKFLYRASRHQRITAGIVFLVISALFGLLWLAADDRFDIGQLLGPCGFKQAYGLPCPTCGMTHSALTFAQGKILQSFYIQPAGALLYSALAVSAFFAFLIAVFGVYFGFLKRFFTKVKIKHIILAVIIIAIAGWAVTLARALV